MTELVNIQSTCVEGCKYIYTPGGPALEYAMYGANPNSGCGHHCLYCYMTKGRCSNCARVEKFHAGAVPKKNFLAHLTADAKKYQAAGITEQVLLSFSTDVYNPFDTSLTRPTIEILQEYGMAFCVLTKGGSRALVDLDLYRPDKDCFTSTLTSLDDDFSKKWESRAALPADRIETLKKFHDAGIFTWVSLEPTLSPEASLKIVEETHGFVDLYKIGRANYIPEYTKGIDWQDYTMRMITKCVSLGAKHYIKENLQKYLPDGYYNPLRVKQHY
jgi:DNA repair photolyase